MLVSENNLLGNRPSVSVLVIWDGRSDGASADGRDWVWEAFVPLDLPVAKLKQMAMTHFMDKAEAAKMENNYRLLLPDQGRRMAEQNTVGDETASGDSSDAPTEIILLKIHQATAVEKPREKDEPAPTQLDIEKATAGMPKVNVNRGANTPFSVVDMQIQLRRIFMTLLETACHLQSDDPAVLNLMQQTLDRVRKKCRDFPEVDKDKLKQLVDMGFSVPRAVRALKMFRHNVRQATDWLLLHPTSSDHRGNDAAGFPRVRIEMSISPDVNVGHEARAPTDVPLPLPPSSSATSTATEGQARTRIPIEYSNSPDDNIGHEAREPTETRASDQRPTDDSSRPDTEEMSAQTLQTGPVSVGDYVFSPAVPATPNDVSPESLPQSPPPPAAAAYAMPTGPVPVKSRPARPWHVLLREVAEALREFHRIHFVPHHGVMAALVEMGFSEEDAEAALQVTGNKRGPACEWLLAGNKGPATRYESGFPRDSPVMTAILQHTTVQMGLMRPKTVAALLNMLEVPMAAQHWLHDPELNAFLSTVFRIFHAERHNLDRPPRASQPSTPLVVDRGDTRQAAAAGNSVGARSTGV